MYAEVWVILSIFLYLCVLGFKTDLFVLYHHNKGRSGESIRAWAKGSGEGWVRKIDLFANGDEHNRDLFINIDLKLTMPANIFPSTSAHA